jgi:site-specific recombinase XerD
MMYIAEYLEHLKEHKPLKASSINLAKSAIVHFFKRNRIKLNKDWISGYVPAEEGYKQDRPYTREEIQRLLGASPANRVRAAISLMTSTSMRVGAITHRVKEDMASVLEFGDYTWILEYKIYEIMVYNRSKGGCYPTYCTPECARMINKYLGYRRECGEIITETSPLIREQFDPTDKLAISHPRTILETTLTKILRAVVMKAGLKDVIAHRELTHGFSKFAITAMVEAGVKEPHRRYLSGHAQGGQDGSYVLLNEQALVMVLPRWHLRSACFLGLS